MFTQDISPQLITDTGIREHFQQSVDEALHELGVAAEAETVYYLVNLLSSFLHTDNLFERSEQGFTLKPLAIIYAEAIRDASPERRSRALQRLGDVALFVAGVFSDSLKRKLVDVDYYIAMGGNAYACLSDGSGGSQRLRALRGVFSELAGKFVAFVDVLNEVSERSRLGSNGDIMRLYELWLRTRSQRAADKLRHWGIEPNLAAATLTPQ